MNQAQQSLSIIPKAEISGLLMNSAANLMESRAAMVRAASQLMSMSERISQSESAINRSGVILGQQGIDRDSLASDAECEMLKAGAARLGDIADMMGAALADPAFTAIRAIGRVEQ